MHEPVIPTTRTILLTLPIQAWTTLGSLFPPCALAIVGIAQPAQAVIFTLGGALRGAGDTRFPLVATIVNWFVVRLPLAYVLAFPLGLGLAGVWAGIAADYFVRAGLLAWRFNSGAWQRVRV